VNELNSGNFGLVISYLLPGMTVLWGFSYPSARLRDWLATTATAGPTVGGFLYVTLAAVAAGLVASTVRWMTVDAVHARTGLRRPEFNYAHLAEKIDGFDVLVRHHYEYYKFHGNMLIAVLFWSLLRHAPRGSTSWSLSAVDLLAVVLMVVLFLGSRDNLRNYYRRTQMLLGPVRDQSRSQPQAAASKSPNLPTLPKSPFQLGDKRGQIGAKGRTDCAQLDNV
jgi:hypothetical protein